MNKKPLPPSFALRIEPSEIRRKEIVRELRIIELKLPRVPYEAGDSSTVCEAVATNGHGIEVPAGGGKA